MGTNGGEDELHRVTFEGMSDSDKHGFNFREGQRAKHAMYELRQHIDRRFDDLTEEIRTPAWRRALTPVGAATLSVLWWINPNWFQRP